MPTLNWIGKEKVVTHHHDVPFRVLDKKYSYGSDDGNMIIHGDNLEALKSLLPEYEGKVKCIYIDPPYNTGNEGWVYNDNVNDPHIRKWLGKVVGSEQDDLTRHDKWLCMMYPRLVLLQKLLSPDVAIFISIDDNEQANLKLICDDIFGVNCFVANMSWQRAYTIRNDSKGVPTEVEHILIYSKKAGWEPNKLERTEEMDKKYKNPDGDHTPWKAVPLTAPDAASHQGMVHAIQHPLTGEMLYPTNKSHWRMQQDDILQIMNQWTAYELKDLHDEGKRATICGIPVGDVRKGVMGVVLSKPFHEAKEEALKVFKQGKWPQIYFSKNGFGGIGKKTYLSSVGGKVQTNFLPYSDVGHSDEATREMKSIFDGVSPFDTPKPTRLLGRIFKIATDQNAIVLDSFAGSGTTAHAVLNLNKQDGGHRKFILVEMMDYAETITAERVRRVIDGYGNTEGICGGFDYYELGATIFDPVTGYLNDDADTEQIRNYVWFSETNTSYASSSGHPYLLGSYKGCDYYFYYIKGEETCLDWSFLNTIKHKAEIYTIYADRCLLTEEEMTKFNIRFKKIPRDIKRV